MYKLQHLFYFKTYYFTATVGPGVVPTGDPAGGKVLTGDLDSSLASLAQNLSINKGGQASVKLVLLNNNF